MFLCNPEWRRVGLPGLIIAPCLLILGIFMPTMKAAADIATPAARSAESVLEQADSLFWGGDTNGAVRVVNTALTDDALDEDPSFEFRLLVRSLLFSGRVAEALARVPAMARADAQAAEPAIQDVVAHLRKIAGPKGVIAGFRTADTLLRLDIPDSLSRIAMQWRLDAALGSDNAAEIAAHVRQLLQAISHDRAVEVGESLLHRLEALGRYDAIMALLEPLETLEQTPERDALLGNYRVSIAMERGQWTGSKEAFEAVVNRLPDERLQLLLQSLTDDAPRKVPDELDSLCEIVLRNPEQRPKSAAVAASAWLNNARDDEDTLPKRFDAMLRWNVDADMLFPLYRKHFYAMVFQPDARSALMRIGEQMMERVADDEARSLLYAMEIDGLFLDHDFAKAIERVGYGLPLFDDHWHMMANLKLLAHKAMEEARPLDAVEHFRAFVNKLRGPHEDPSTGIEHSLDMIQGRNVRRIGDLYRQAGRENDALKAYEEARAHFAVALELLDPESEATKIARDEAHDIP